MIAQRHFGPLLGLGMVLCLLSVTGIFRSLDGWFFDRLISLAPTGPISCRALLVIECEEPLDAEERHELVMTLNAQGARWSVLFQPTGDEIGVDRATVCPWMGGAVSGEAPAVAPPGHGIWRGVAPAEGGIAPSTLSEVAAALGLPPPPSRFYLDFKVSRGGFQRVDAARLLAGDLPRSLIDGKVMLLGQRDADARMITTPRDRGPEALSPLLYGATVIDTMLRDGIVHLAPLPIHWGIAFVLAGVFALAVRRRNLENLHWYVLGGVLLAVVGAWVVLWGGHWWLPPTRPVFLIAAGGGLARSAYRKTQQRALRGMLMQLAVEVQGRAEADGFLTTASPWGRIESLLRQSFALDLSFVLRTGDATESLEPVTPSGAKQSDRVFGTIPLRLGEEPFATAVREKGASLDDDIVVVPIRGPSVMFGLWVFQRPPDLSPEQAQAYAGRLAAMLQHRLEWRRRARPYPENVDGSPALPIRPLHDQLQSSVDLLDRGRRTLADALDGSREAVLVFDPFGALLHISRRSVHLLATAKIEAAHASPAELLGRLTNAEPTEVARTLRYVALGGEEAVLQASPMLVPGREFLVVVRGLSTAANAKAGPVAALPGLMLLIDDVTLSARTTLLKDEFVERIYFQLNNDFEGIQAAALLLDDPRVEGAERKELLAMLNDKVEEATLRMRAARSHLQTEYTPMAVERYPIRFGPVLDAALAAVETERESHLVTMEASISDYLQLVLAGPKPLEALLRAILLALVHDAREESRLVVEAVQEDAALRVQLRNNGFGMPQETLDRYLQAGAETRGTLGEIGAGLKTVEAWGGELSVRSEVGAGIVIDLKLVSVI